MLRSFNQSFEQSAAPLPQLEFTAEQLNGIDDLYLKLSGIYDQADAAGATSAAISRSVDDLAAQQLTAERNPSASAAPRMVVSLLLAGATPDTTRALDYVDAATQGGALESEAGVSLRQLVAATADIRRNPAHGAVLDVSLNKITQQYPAMSANLDLALEAYCVGALIATPQRGRGAMEQLARRLQTHKQRS